MDTVNQKAMQFIKDRIGSDALTIAELMGILAARDARIAELEAALKEVSLSGSDVAKGKPVK